MFFFFMENIYYIGDYMIVIDNEKIYIKDYKEVLMMDHSIFKIEMNLYDLYIYGRELEMYYYDYHEIRLNGIISEISFHEHRV